MKPIISLCVSIIVCVTTISYSQNVGFDVTPDSQFPEVFVASQPYSIPILRSDMPWDVAIGYITLDTICKTYTSSEISEQLEFLSNDSLKIAYHLLNRMLDYDPFLVQLLTQYTIYHLPPNYKSNYASAFLNLYSEYDFRFNNVPRNDYRPPNLKIFNELVQRSEGIYHIKELTSASRLDTSASLIFGEDCPAYVFWADAQVVTIYKGQRFYSNCNVANYPELSPNRCMRFTWSLYSCDSNRQKRFALESDKEYLVFNDVAYGKGFDLAHEETSKWENRALVRFEIVSGFVYDPAGYFELGEMIPLEVVETKIFDAIHEHNGQ